MGDEAVVGVVHATEVTLAPAGLDGWRRQKCQFALFALGTDGGQQMMIVSESVLLNDFGLCMYGAKVTENLKTVSTRLVYEEQERDPFTDLRRLLQSSDLTLTGMLSDLD